MLFFVSVIIIIIRLLSESNFYHMLFEITNRGHLSLHVFVNKTVCNPVCVMYVQTIAVYIYLLLQYVYRYVCVTLKTGLAVNTLCQF